jgi:hypothetical protein
MQAFSRLADRVFRSVVADSAEAAQMQSRWDPFRSSARAWLCHVKEMAPDLTDP